MSLRLTVTVKVALESGWSTDSGFVNAELTRLVAPAVTKLKDVGLDEGERLQAALAQVTADVLREAQQQARQYAEHTHVMHPPTPEVPQ